MRPSSLLLWFPILAIHCKASDDAVLTTGASDPLDAGDSNSDMPRTDSGKVTPQSGEDKPDLDGGGGAADGGHAGESSVEGGTGGSAGPAQGDCFVPQQNQDVDYASAVGCPCAGEEPVCVATASGALQDLACVDGVWSAMDTPLRG